MDVDKATYNFERREYYLISNTYPLHLPLKWWDNTMSFLQK